MLLFLLFLFGAVLLSAFYTYMHFLRTKESIVANQLRSNLEYIEGIASNLSKSIVEQAGERPLVQALKESVDLRKGLEKDLELFKTRRYRYIYVVYKDKNRFKFLLDASKKDKAGFLEVFQPLNPQAWEVVYRTKKPNYFINKKIKSLWLTYLKPILRNGQVAAVIVIDFSLTEQEILHAMLERLSQDLQLFSLLVVSLFIVVLLVLFYIWKRASSLNKQAQEIYTLNATLQEKIEQEVAKNREKDRQILEQARLAQLGEMLGMIAHQWRQPLSAISSATIAINMKAQLNQLDPQSIKELTDKIEDLTQHLSRTIDDFRNFFKNTKEKKQVGYNEIVSKALQIVQSSLKVKNIEVITDLKSDRIFETYPSEVEQVVLNLIKNAEDVLIERKVEHPRIKITTKGNILEVSDNGGGVPEEIIEKIFDPYFSTKALNGTGLGLYMSKTIIEEHCKGRLSVRNDSEGAVFTIELG